MTNPRRPRIALVAHDIHDGGGMERAFAELIRRANARFDFTVFASGLAPELRPLVAWRRVHVPRRPIPLKMVAFFLAVSRPLARADVDLVHMLGAIAPNRADVITVQCCHRGAWERTRRLAPSGAPPLRRLNTAIAQLLALLAERFCYRSARVRVLAGVSRGLNSELEAHFEGPRLALTPNGVDPMRFAPDAGARAALRLAEGVRDEIVCLFVGGNWDHKGLAIVMQAIAASRNDRLRLWVVGPGDRPRFARIASRLELGERVRFFGPRSDAERFYQAADIFVFPTQYESFSIVAHEAAASGLPVVATRVSGIEDLVVDGETGFLIDRTPDAVAAALARLARDPGLRERMGQEGRCRAAASTWEQSVDAVTSLYDRLLDARGTNAVAA